MPFIGTMKDMEKIKNNIYTIGRKVTSANNGFQHLSFSATNEIIFGHVDIKIYYGEVHLNFFLLSLLFGIWI